MTIRAYVMLVCALLLAKPLAAESIPFEVCAESTTWTRPTPEVQAKIWNDARYKDEAGTAYAWTHNFIALEPESASIPYHLMNESGLWTAIGTFAKCYSPPRRGYEWIEVWALLHRVIQVTRCQHLHHHRRADSQGIPVHLHPPPESERCAALRHTSW